MSLPSGNIAVGSYEASCLLGVHWTMVGKLAEAGLVGSRIMPGRTARGSVRIYSSESIDENFDEYMRLNTAGRVKRPRSCIEDRESMMGLLGLLTGHVLYEDAISCHQASDVIGIHVTHVARMVMRGDVVGRKLIGNRGEVSKYFVISLSSCLSERDRAERESAHDGRLARRRPQRHMRL